MSQYVPRPPNFVHEPLESFGAAGTAVSLVGLRTQNELNGQCGVAQGHDGSRVIVKLDGSGAKVRVRPMNLTYYSPPAVLDRHIAISSGAPQRPAPLTLACSCARLVSLLRLGQATDETLLAVHLGLSGGGW